MHHPKEAVIDGVKFVLIPEELYERMCEVAHSFYKETCFGKDLLESIEAYEAGK